MSRSPLLSSLLAGLCSVSVLAQTPVNPPPWWRVDDEVTVTLGWNFNTPFPAGAPPVAPDVSVLPPWYSNPAPWTNGPEFEWQATLSGHVGVLKVTSGATPISATIELFIDNDPHLDWVKVFWFQYEVFEGTSGGSIVREIREQLTKYGRVSIKEDIEGIGSGWQRVTVYAQLIPQPDDESIAWDFTTGTFDTIAIDNLFISSKCVKPRPDEDGLALGLPTTSAINLTLATGGRECLAVARTQGSSPTTQSRYWVATRSTSPASPHEVFQLNNAGVLVNSPVPLPSSAQSSPTGPTGMAVRREYGPPPGGQIIQEWVHAIDDRRSLGGQVTIFEIDTVTNTVSRTLPLQSFPPTPVNLPLGLAYDPTGELGDGTFWVTAADPLQPGVWAAYEFSHTTGALLSQRSGLPAMTTGYAYDETLGKFYAFSADPVSRPSGPDSRVNGYEISGFDHEQTGVQFCGDLTLTGGVGVPPGGIAAGLDLYRTNASGRSEVRFVCVADFDTEQFLYELAGPYLYGYSRYGHCGMENGPPFVDGTVQRHARRRAELAAGRALPRLVRRDHPVQRRHPVGDDDLHPARHGLGPRAAAAGRPLLVPDHAAATAKPQLHRDVLPMGRARHDRTRRTRLQHRWQDRDLPRRPPLRGGATSCRRRHRPACAPARPWPLPAARRRRSPFDVQLRPLLVEHELHLGAGLGQHGGRPPVLVVACALVRHRREVIVRRQVADTDQVAFEVGDIDLRVALVELRHPAADVDPATVDDRLPRRQIEQQVFDAVLDLLAGFVLPPHRHPERLALGRCDDERIDAVLHLLERRRRVLFDVGRVLAARQADHQQRRVEHARLGLGPEHRFVLLGPCGGSAGTRSDPAPG